MGKTAAVITLHNSPNYGSCLQAYATQCVLSSFDFKPEIVNFYRQDAVPENEVDRALNGQLVKKLPFFRVPGVRALARIPVSRMVARRRTPLDEFRRERLNLTRRAYYSADELESDPPIADVYVTGSDQVWNSEWNGGFERSFYLSFAPEGARRIAYAASIGKAGLDDWEIAPMRDALLRYDAISVREAEAVDLLESIGISNAVPVVDPTLMLDREEWGAVADGWISEIPYILVYQLNRNPEFDAYVQSVSKVTGLPVVRPAYGVHERRRGERTVLCPSVGHFLSLFLEAHLVITDSFHGTAFSVNFEKPFVSIAPERFSGRIGNLLAMTGLEERLLDDWRDVMLATRELDFSTARDSLAYERRHARDFLCGALGLDERDDSVSTNEGNK